VNLGCLGVVRWFVLPFMVFLGENYLKIDFFKKNPSPDFSATIMVLRF
jgi:hypothetical protein